MRIVFSARMPESLATMQNLAEIYDIEVSIVRAVTRITKRRLEFVGSNHYRQVPGIGPTGEIQRDIGSRALRSGSRYRNVFESDCRRDREQPPLYLRSYRRFDSRASLSLDR